MAKYILKRVVAAILTVWVLITIVFFLVRLMPGEPFTSAKLTPEVKANMEAYYGFDKPMIVQYGTYMANLLQGDFGYSMKYTNRTVNDLIGETFPYSADLGIRALVMAVSIGLILGIISARNRGRKLISSALLSRCSVRVSPTLSWARCFSISLVLNGVCSRWQGMRESNTRFCRPLPWRSIRWHLFHESCVQVCWK